MTVVEGTMISVVSPATDDGDVNERAELELDIEDEGKVDAGVCDDDDVDVEVVVKASDETFDAKRRPRKR